VKIQQNSSFFSILLACVIASTVGCGGGSSDTRTPPSDISWSEGVFEDESQFKDFCENPRSGTDLLGREFRDQPGSTLLENHWLRSWSNNTYLWYSEIIDQNPANFSDTISYFDTLKTNATTPSGSAKDNFHFTIDSAEYLELSQSGVSSGYGLQWAIISGAPPRKLRVAFSQPNGPAAAQNVFRGAEVLEVDGIDFVNDNTQSGLEIINAAIFPANSGESHTFVIRDLGTTQTRSVTLVSADVQEEAILANDVIATNSGNVAYVMYNTFRSFSEQSLIDTFDQLESQNISDLVLDLRYNGGGLVNIASELGYMIAGDVNTDGKIFEQIRFNDKHPTINPVTGELLSPVPFYTETVGSGSSTAGIPLPTLNLDRLFVLSTDGTCSASEAVINALRGIDVEVILIGDSTCGKPYGFYATDNCGTTYFTIQLTGENDKGFGEYPDGFSPENEIGALGVTIPGCSVADDFDHALGDTEEALLKQALDFRETGTCNTQAINKLVQNSQAQFKADNALSIKKPKKLNVKILSHPREY